MLFLKGLSWIGFTSLLGVVFIFIGLMFGFAYLAMVGILMAVLFVPAVVVWALVSFVIEVIFNKG